MFSIRSNSENQRDPLVREAQEEYERTQRSRPQLTPSQRAMARARGRRTPVANPSRHQGVSPRGRTSSEEARARAQARAVTRVQHRSPGTYAMLPPPPPSPSRRLSPGQLTPTQMAQMRAAERARARSPSRTLEQARADAQARTMAR